MRSNKPCIRYLQIHKNGELYVQFESRKPFSQLADAVVPGKNPFVEFVVRDYNGAAVSDVAGQVVKIKKSGIVLKNWSIKNELS